MSPYRPVFQTSQDYLFRGPNLILLVTIPDGNLSQMFCILLFLRKLRIQNGIQLFSWCFGTNTGTPKFVPGSDSFAGMGRARVSDKPSLRWPTRLTSLSISSVKQTDRYPQNTGLWKTEACEDPTRLSRMLPTSSWVCPQPSWCESHLFL